MPESVLAAADRHFTEAVDELRAATASGSDHELLSVLTLFEGMARRLDQLVVTAVSAAQRRGVFTERGYTSLLAGLCDLTGCERYEARRRVIAAEQVCDRVGLDGTALPARMPATAQVFAAGKAGLRHVEVIAKVLASAAAGRLIPEGWAGAEAELADKATCYTPGELHAWGTALVDALDDDGAPPDDRDPEPVNTLTLHRRPDGAGGGGTLKGTFEDAALFDTIATLIDAKAKPLDADDLRGTERRQAEALAEICGYVLDHGDVPEAGGFRPHLNVLIRLEDLQDRALAATLDFGGTLTPAALRMLACDAAVVPIVMGGDGQPLDVGRATRAIPDGLRRAVAARDLGCAFPGCNRTPSWCQIHHILEWERGGETKLENLVMLCRIHHRLLHHSGWLVSITGGLPEFIPPAWIDPERTPRRRPLPHLLAGP